MALDVATLGLALDSRQIKAGREELDKLVQTGTSAEASAKKTGSAWSTAAKQMATDTGRIADGIAKLNASQSKQESLLGELKGGFNSLAGAIAASTASQQAHAVAANATNAALRAEVAGSKAVESAVIAMGAAVSGTSAQIKAIATATQALISIQEKAAATAGATGAAIRSQGDQATASQTAMLAYGKVIAAVFVTERIVGFTKSLFDASAESQRLQSSINFASGGRGTQEMAYLTKLTNSLGLELSSTAKAYAGFAASARGTTLEGEGTRRAFEGVAKASAVMGLSTADTSGVLLAMSQMLSKGTVQSEELKGQIGERLPGAFALAAKAMGVTEAALGKMLEKGEVVASDFIPRFAQALENVFGPAAEKAADRMDASVIRFVNSWEALKKSLGDAGVASAFASAAAKIGTVFDLISTSINKLSSQGPLRQAADEVLTLDHRATVLRNGLANGFYGPKFQRELDDVNAKLETAKQKFRGLNIELNTGAGVDVDATQSRRLQDLTNENRRKKIIADNTASYLADDARQTQLQIRQEQGDKARAKAAEQIKLNEGNSVAQAKIRAALEVEIGKINEKNKDKVDTAGNTAATDRINAGIEATKRAQALADEQAKRSILEINSAREMGTLTQTDAINQLAAIEATRSAAELASLDKQIAQAATKKNSEKELATLRGEADLVRAKQQTAERGRELAILQVEYQRAAVARALHNTDDAKGLQDLATMEASNKVMREEIEALGLTDKQLQALNLTRLDSTIARKQENIQIARRFALDDESQRNLDIEQRQLDELIKSRELYNEKATKARDIEQQKTYYADLWQGVDKAGREAFDAIGEKGVSVADRIGKALKASVLDMLYKLTLQKFIINIGTSIFGEGFSNAANAATGQGGGSGLLGAANTANSLKNVYGAASQFMFGASAGSSTAALAGANAAGLVGGDSIGTLAYLNGGWAGVGAGAGAAGLGAGATTVATGAESGAAFEAYMLGQGSVAVDGAAGAAVATGATAGAEGGAAAAGLMSNPVGWIALAAIAAYAIFGSSGGGPKQDGGVYTVGNYNDGGTQYGTDNGVTTKGGALDAGAKGTLDTLTTQYGTLVKQLGGVAGAVTGVVQISRDPIGDAATQLELIAQLNGKDVYSRSAEGRANGTGGINGIEDVGRSDEELAQAIALAQTKALIGLLKGSDGIDPSIKELIDNIDTTKASVDELNAVLARVTAFAAFKEALQKLPFEELRSLTIKAAESLIGLMGGLEGFDAAITAYYDKYYSDTEKVAYGTAQMSKALTDLGMTMPDLSAGADAARTAYRKMLEEAGKNLGTDEGLQLYAALLKLAPTFSDLADQSDALKKAADDQAKADADAIKAAADKLKAEKEAREAAAKAAVDGAMKGLQNSVNIEKKRIATEKQLLSDQRDTVNDALSNLNTVFDMLHDNIVELYGTVAETAAMQAAQGWVTIEKALETARAGGKVDSAGLSEAITAARGGLNENNYANSFDQKRDTLNLAGTLSDLEDLTGAQKTTAELQLDSLNDQLSALDKQTERLDQMLDFWQQQIDIANGNLNVNLSIAAAVNALSALLFPDSPTPSAGVIGAPAFGGGGTTTGPTIGGPTSKYSYETFQGDFGSIYDPVTDKAKEQSLDKLAAIYAGTSGTGDVAGLYAQAVAAGYDVNDLSAVTGFHVGDWKNALHTAGVSGFEDGTNYVPQDMLALIHQGERITPRNYNAAADSALGTDPGVIMLLTAIEANTRGGAVKLTVINDLWQRLAPNGDAVATREAAAIP